MKCNASSILGRRAFLKLSGLAAFGTCLELPRGAAAQEILESDPTHVLHIRRTQVELAPGRVITTTTYNGQLPGPLLRATVGQRMRIDVYNETDTAERVNWHGQDMAVDEASHVPPQSLRRMEFTPRRPGLYLYHSNLIAAARLDTGLYTGQAGALLVEPEHQSDHPDVEWVVVLKECEPFIRRTRRGCEIAYRTFTINGRPPGLVSHARFNNGDRVLLHVLNASATEPLGLALPGHSFEVIALDGNPVPSPATIPTLLLSPGERVSARVELHQPGDWILDRREEAWDYTRFGSGGGSTPVPVPAPDGNIELVLTRHDAARSGFNRWSINGTSFSTSDPRPLIRLRYGLRYRLTISNTSDELIPIHLQRHRLQIVSIAGTPTAGILKDVVSVGARQQLEVDFVADNPGPCLLYCTRQLHRDFGLMALLDYT